MRALLFSFACCLAITPAVIGSPDSTAAEPALQRFLARPDEPVTQYRARRLLEGHNDRFNMHGALEAVTELSSSGQFTYSIVKRSGSEYIREKLEQLLETEARMIRSGDPSRAALTADNYQLSAGSVLDSGLVKLLAKPRRKELSLIDGAIFVTSGDADLVRVEGRMAKNPSFWTSKVYLVRHYERISGVRVPVRLDSTAAIKIAGQSKLSMVYEYEMINGISIVE